MNGNGVSSKQVPGGHPARVTRAFTPEAHAMAAPPGNSPAHLSTLPGDDHLNASVG